MESGSVRSLRTSGLCLLGLAALSVLGLSGSPTHAEDAPAEEAAPLDDLERRVEELYGAGKYKEALEVSESLVAKTETVHGAEHLRTARVLGMKGLCLQALGRLEEAEPLLARSLALAERLVGPESSETVSASFNLAMLHRDRGRYAEALALMERTVPVAERTLAPDDPVRGIVWNNFALILQDAGQLERALDLFRKVVEFRTRVQGPDSPATATAWNNLGSLLDTMRDLPGAEQALRRALEVRERTLGPDHPATASSLNNVALLLTSQGRAEEAVPLFERAVAIREKRQGPHHALTGLTLGNLGLALKSLGRLDAAQALYERALAVTVAARGADHPVVAVHENKLAVLLQVRGELEQARVHHERALAIRRARLGPQDQFTGESLNNLGLTLWLLKRPVEGEALFRDALAAFEASLGPDHPYTSHVWNNLALSLRMRGELAEARVCCERALAVKEQMLGPKHQGLALLLTNLGEIALLEKDVARARALFARSLDIVEANAHRALGLLHGPERLALVESVRWVLESRLEVGTALGDTGYEAVLRFKGLVGRLERAEQRLRHEGGSGSAARFQALATAHRRLAALSDDRAPRRDAARHAAWQEAYAKAAADVDRLARELAAGRDGPTATDAAVTLPQLARALGDGVLVDVLRSEERYLAWVVRGDAEVVRVDLGPSAPIEEAADVLSDALASSTSVAEEWQAAASALADLVWKPLAAHVGEAPKTLYLSPDARLATVPFELLAPAARAVRRVAMAQDLVPTRGPTVPGDGALYVGDVSFDGAPGPPAGEPVPRAARTGGRFPPLSGTRREVEVLAARDGKAAKTLLAADATEAALRREVPGRRVVHLATHGFVRGDLATAFRRRGHDDPTTSGAEDVYLTGYDPRVLAGLALAGANVRKGGGEDDGILTALEASSLHLGACELAVLSACETARGTAQSGEGVLGLVQAMQVAGARHVVASLWKVDDEATQALMTAFYALRAGTPGTPGLPVPAALRAAQDHVRKEPRWSHPFYWAAWVGYERAQ